MHATGTEARGLRIGTTGSPELRRPARLGAGRVTLLVLGSLAVLASVAVVAGGGVALVFDQTQRDANGFLMSHAQMYSTSTYALVSDSYRAGASGDVFAIRDILGKVRIQAHSSEATFVGVGPAAAVDHYLANVRRSVANRFDAASGDFRVLGSRAPERAPTAQRFWSARTTGSGTYALSWSPKKGSYRIVIMRPDATPGVTATVRVGARFPHLLAIGLGLLGGGAVGILVGSGVLFGVLRRRPR
jgi:hypothetical protein